MAETKTNTIELTLTYTDYTTRKYKIPIQDPDASETVKTAIRNFNTAAQTAGSNVQQTFVSNTGAPVASINEAVIVERTEEVLYDVN